jgi:hypothetical protein
VLPNDGSAVEHAIVNSVDVTASWTKAKSSQGKMIFPSKKTLADLPTSL